MIATLRRIRYTGKLQRGDYAELAAASDLLEAIETDCNFLSECTVTSVGGEPLFDDIDEGETLSRYKLNGLLEPNQELSFALGAMARRIILGDESSPEIALDHAEAFLADVIYHVVPDKGQADEFCERISAVLREALTVSQEVR
jgi:hypothetical protein